MVSTLAALWHLLPSLFEVKWDGFRALLYSDKDGVRLGSRNGNNFKSFPRLRLGLAHDLKSPLRAPMTQSSAWILTASRSFVTCCSGAPSLPANMIWRELWRSASLTHIWSSTL